MNKKQSNSVMEMFNLPSYTKGKTFAEASKLIANKFEGRTDKESIDTLQELQTRLQKAQEYIKAQSQPQQTEVDPSQMTGSGETNDHFLGGIMNMIGGAGGAAGAAGGAVGSAIPGLGALAKAPESISHFKDGNAAKGIMSAASGVASMIPGVGSIAAPILDIATGFIGNGAAKEKAIQEDVNNTAIQRKAYNNSYEEGGFMDSTDPNELINMLNRGTATAASALTPRPIAGMRGLPNSDIVANNMKSQGVTDMIKSPEEQLAANAAKATSPLYPVTESSTSMIDEPVKSGYDPSQLLRYAPAVTDAYQLATLEKPEAVTRGRLGNTYDTQQVDERQLVNQVQEGVGNQRNAILEASGGSGAAARANLLGLSLQGTKALSNAMAQAEEQNRQENRAAQQFKLGVDTTNLQQSNEEQLGNEQNKGAYETQKSQLISQLGSNLGEIGKEQLFKKYPELMGMDFNALGKYINGKKKKKGTTV